MFSKAALRMLREGTQHHYKAGNMYMEPQRGVKEGHRAPQSMITAPSTAHTWPFHMPDIR